MERVSIIDGVQKCVYSQLGGVLPGLEANINDLGADSLDRVELVMMIESDFGISIPDDDWVKVQTVEQIVKLVEVRV